MSERDVPGRPTAEFVQALYRMKVAEGAEARLRSISQTMRVLTRHEHNVSIPRQYKSVTKEIKTPFVRDTWHRVTAALTDTAPQRHVEPMDKDKASRAAANIAERWVEGADERMNKSLGEDVFYESPKSLVRDGESVLKVVHVPDAWANFPDRKMGEEPQDYLTRAEKHQKSYGQPFPFAWRVPDRLQYVFGDGEFGDEWYIEYGEYSLPYLASRYGMVANREYGRDRLVDPAHMLGGRPAPEGMLSAQAGYSVKIEYMNAESWHVVIDGEDAPGFPKDNPYGCLNAFRAKSPDSESILYSLMWLVPRLDELLTMKLNWTYIGSYPTPVITRDANYQETMEVIDPGATEPTKAVWRPGKQMELQKGEALGFLAPPPIGDDLNQMVGVMRQMIEIAGLPSVLRGDAASGEAGYLYNQRAAAALLTIKRLAKAEQRQFEQSAEFRWKQIAHLVKGPVYVQGASEQGRAWLGLTDEGSVSSSTAPVDMLGPISYAFKPVLPTDSQALAMIAVQLTNPAHPLITDNTAREKWLQIEDPEGEEDRIWVQKAINEDPTLRQLVIDTALRESGMMAPPPPPAPPPMILGPDGMPLAPSGMNGQMAGGLPSVPGLTMPMQPPPGQAPSVGTQGGRAAGTFPGQPGGQGQ